jgi:glycosyltransferase involved in cell wall biosynthesis
MADVSVLIPTFRRPAELRACLQSIVASQLCPAEVIVGDDGGDAETRAVCESFKGFFPLVHLPPCGPGSLPANLARLVAQAKSPWCYLLHDDDFMVGDHRELLAAEQNACDILFTDHWVCDAAGVIDEAESARNSAAYTRSSLSAGAQQDLVALVYHEAICLDGYYARTEFLRRVSPDPQLGGTADSFWLGAILLSSPSPRVSYLPFRSFAYRLNPSGLTSTGIDARTLFNGLCGLSRVSPEFGRMSRNKRNRFGIQAGFQCLRSGRHLEAQTYLNRAAAGFPPLLRPWLPVLAALSVWMPRMIGCPVSTLTRIASGVRKIFKRRIQKLSFFH